MNNIRSKIHDSADQESNLRADPSQCDELERLADTHKTSPMEELRAIVRKLGGPVEARKLLADGSQQRPSSNPARHTESLKTLVGLLAEQHSTQRLSEEEDGV
jgi:hypothetical protein